MMVRPTCRISCCCAATTTGPSTTRPGTSASTPTTTNPNSCHHPNPASKDSGSDIDHDANDVPRGAGSGCVPQPDRQAGHASLELDELADVDRDDVEAALLEEPLALRRVGAHQHAVLAEEHDVRPGGLGHIEERRPDLRVVDEGL